MHDRRQSGQEPTVVVDEPTVPNLSIEDLGIGVDGGSTDTTNSDLGETGAPSAEEPESLLARRAKLIALLLAALALVGSVVVASTLADDAGASAAPGTPASNVLSPPDFGDGARSVVNHATPSVRHTL